MEEFTILHHMQL